MNTKRLGVLGGIGPEATSEFYSKLIDRLQKRGLIKQNADFPQIVINSIPAPELIYEDIRDEDLTPYFDGLKELENFGVDLLVMVCNTIHLYYDDLQNRVNVPIVNLRDELKDFLDRNKIKSTLVIGTPMTVKKGLYDYEGIVAFSPSDKELSQLTNAIFNFNKGVEKEKQVETVKKICDKYLVERVSVIVLGCTELAVMLDQMDYPSINTIDLLVEAVIQKMIKSLFELSFL